MTNRGSLLAGVALGTGLTYFLDPGRSARRRARLRDTAAHTSNLASRAVGKIARDTRHRASGTAASLRSLVRHEPVDDAVLVERVRAKLGRLTSHSHAVEVTASEGVVTLKGPILEREVSRLIRTTSRVRGVSEVVNQLDVHERAGHVPSLQGGRAPAGDRMDLLQTNWAPSTRALLGTAGAALVAAGAFRRDGPGVSAALIGATLFTRAVTNLPLNRLTGIASRRRAIDVQKTITINASVGEVYAFWSVYENFPRFMSRVLEVRSSEHVPMQSHWKVAGPAGVPVEFDAEVTRTIPNHLIAWRTLPGSPVKHAGLVRFDPEIEGRTRVHIRMSYNPPAGWLGHGIAAAFGVDPKRSMDEDLVRMKTLIETGHAPHDAAQRQAHPAAP
jgi:uncharacterized membrane protein/osmotically-inducible protein OsmY